MFYYKFEKYIEEMTSAFVKKDKILEIDSILRPSYIIDENIGNNKYGFCTGRKLVVPPIIKGYASDIKEGHNIIFREILDDNIIEYTGIKDYIIGFTENSRTPVFICDNHNSVLEAWHLLHKSQLQLIHIDQHRDNAIYAGFLEEWKTESVISDYINFAICANWIKKDYLSFTENSDMSKINQFKKADIILNIDIDFFSKNMTIIPLEDKIKLICHFAQFAKLITLATSPGFIEQNRAIKIAKLLFKYL